MTAIDVAPRRSWPERIVAALSRSSGRTDRSRRRLLFRGTLVAAALALDPIRYVLRPGSAWASVCGRGNTCGGGWTAFCCTINDGDNRCPPGTYAAGWWKVDNSAFCNGAPRYIIDCNRHPSASCSCHCANDACDNRKVCCNVFRYGQCHTEVRGVTEVVCRVIICTTPWKWDPTCSSTIRTDNRTATHTSRCLPGQHPSQIEIRHQDTGMAGSPVGRRTSDERDTDSGGRRSDHEHGLFHWTSATGAVMVLDPFAATWDRTGADTGPLGRPIADTEPVGDDRGRRTRFEGGTIWSSPTTGTHAVTGRLRDHYVKAGGVGGWLGYPVTGVEEVDGPWRRVRTERSWQVVEQTSRGQTRVLPDDVELPPDGTWPEPVAVERWAGRTRVDTAVTVARRAFPDGATHAVLVTATDFPDALVGGIVAAAQDGPLLLVGRDGLEDVVADTFDDLGVRRITVLGGAAAVADEVVEELRADGYRVERVHGEDRFATAVAASRSVTGGARRGTVHVATGRDFPDALGAATRIVATGGPLLLVEPDRIPEVVADELRRLDPAEIVVLGGTRAVSRDVEHALASYAPAVRRVAGNDRYATAVATIPRDADTSTLLVATGESFPDGLAAGAAAVALGGELVLSRQQDVPDVTWRLAREGEVRRVILVGGESVLSPGVERQFTALVMPPPEEDPADDPSEQEPSEGPVLPAVTPSATPTDG